MAAGTTIYDVADSQRMRLFHVWVPLLLMAVAFSGCTESDGSSKTAELPASSSTSLAPTSHTDPVPPEVTEEPNGLQSIKELHWAINEARGDTALEVLFRMPETDCEAKVAVSGKVKGSGTRKIAVLESGSGLMGWGAGGGGTLARAHVGPVDTDDVIGIEGNYGSLSGFGFTGSETVRLTLIALGVEPSSTSSFLKNASLALSVVCEEPFDVVGARQGSQLAILSAGGGDGGAGVDVFAAGSANVQDRVGIDSTAPSVRVFADGFGYQAARANVDHPGGSEEWMWDPVGGDFQSVEGGPGHYGATLDHAGLVFEAFWLAMFGFDSTLDLTSDLQAESAIDSPF